MAVRKYWRQILAVVAGIIALPFLVALFISTEMRVEKSIVINRPKTEVFEYIKYLRNHEQFNKWAQLDSHLQKTYHGQDGTRGFRVTWESELPEVGKSEQEITQIVEGERVDILIRFKEPFVSSDPAFIATADAGSGQTRVTSGYQSWIPYPMNLLCLTVRPQVEKGIEFGLHKLKDILETPPPALTASEIP